MTPWYERDDFWLTMPVFREKKMEAAPQEVDGVLSLLGIHPGAAVLDLCCGVGRHSLELARRGYRVTGLDRSAPLLERGRDAASAEGLQVEWVQADMREFTRAQAFDAIVNLFTSFGYFEDPADDQQVAINAFRSLKPSGAFVLQTKGKEVLARHFRPRSWEELPDGSLWVVERRITKDWTWFENRWILIKGGERHEYTVSHRIYDGAGLRGLLLHAGLASVNLYGTLDGAPYDTDARQLIAVARKSPNP
jgi:SAM-dependent methyltransferase